MLEEQIKQYIGKFGIITTEGEFPKTIPGVIKEMDGFNNIWFIRSICNECYKEYRRQYSKKYKADMKKKHRCVKSKKCYLHGYATDPVNEVCNMKPCTYCRYYK